MTIIPHPPVTYSTVCHRSGSAAHPTSLTALLAPEVNQAHDRAEVAKQDEDRAGDA